MQHQDKTRHNCPCRWVSVRLLLLTLIKSQRRNQTTAESRLRGDQWERQTGGRQACVWSRGERGGISAWTERLWSGRGRPAVTGHIWPMVHSWTSMSGCQVSERGPAGTPRCWYHLLAVYANPRPLQRLQGIPALLRTPSFPLSHQRRPKQWLTALYSWDRKPHNKCIYCL